MVQYLSVVCKWEGRKEGIDIPEKLLGASRKRARQKTTPRVTVLIIRLDIAGNVTEEAESRRRSDFS